MAELHTIQNLVSKRET